MHRILAPLSNRWSRRSLAGAAVAFVAAIAVGVGDSVIGVALLVVACAGVVAAFTTGWVRPRPFLILAAAALVGFPVFVVLHNAFYALGMATAGVPVLPPVADVLGAVAFLMAVPVCPAAFLVGAAGALATRIRATRAFPS